MHRLGLGLFGPMVWKLLIIDPFSQRKLNKIEIKNFIGFQGILGVGGKPLASQI
jgi:hypothetical protein